MIKATSTSYSLVMLCIVLVCTGMLWLWFSLDVLFSWLIAVNLITFLTYGYDKWIAGSSMMRIPESLLLVLALLGGTLGALFGMLFFRHKTAKTSFKRKFRLVVLLQAVLLAVYFFLV